MVAERHAYARTEAERSYSMIRKDFPELSVREIEENTENIEDYYAKNMNYLIMSELAENQASLTNNEDNRAIQYYNGCDDYESDEQKNECVFNELITSGFEPLLTSYALSLSRTHANEAAGEYYPRSETNHSDNGGVNNRADAYRHVFLNTQLADNYLSIFGKQRRLNFAETVADANENCGQCNEVDSRAMDFHNNAIGRRLWDDATSIVWFLGIPIGIDTPTMGEMKSQTENAVNYDSWFIVKIKNENAFPNNLLDENLLPDNIEEKIECMDNDIVFRWRDRSSLCLL